MRGALGPVQFRLYWFPALSGIFDNETVDAFDRLGSPSEADFIVESDPPIYHIYGLITVNSPIFSRLRSLGRGFCPFTLNY